MSSASKAEQEQCADILMDCFSFEFCCCSKRLKIEELFHLFLSRDEVSGEDGVMELRRGMLLPVERIVREYVYATCCSDIYLDIITPLLLLAASGDGQLY